MKSKIVGQKKSEIDWSKVQLVKSETTGIVVLTNGRHRNKSFEGTVLVGNENDTVGSYFEDWATEIFIPITENTLIEFTI